MMTRAQAEIFKPRDLSYDFQLFSATKKDNLNIATLTGEGIKNSLWKSTMKEEMMTLSKNQTWKSVPYHLEMNLVGNK